MRARRTSESFGRSASTTASGWLTRRSIVSCGLAIACGASVMVACGTTDRPSFVEPPNTGTFGEADAQSTACETATCSRDLHSVLSGCTGDVIRKCPPDAGCADGACVPACASAESNEGTIGCSFWATPAVATLRSSAGSVREDHRGSCFAAFIANTWSLPVNVRVEHKGEALDLSRSIAIPRVTGGEVDYEILDGPLPPGEVAIVFLYQNLVPPPSVRDHVSCPLPAALESEEATIPLRSGFGAAFHIATDLPVSAYSIFPYGGAASHIPAATVLLPTSSWDTKYLAVDGWDPDDRGTSPQEPTLQIVAANDDTEVRIRHDLAKLPGGSPSSDERSQIFKLAKGEVLQFAAHNKLAGAPIESDKPIAVFGGSNCSVFPTTFGTCCCDVTQQQIPPIRAWGTEYAGVRYEDRKRLRLGSAETAAQESAPWRLIGAADGTTLEYQPRRPPGAPIALSQGEAVTFWTAEPFVVKSQDEHHPFYLASYMSSLSYGDGAGPLGGQIGDPEFVNVVPARQYLDAYTFFTDVTYGYTTLVVVRQDRGAGFEDVVLDCAGTITDWTTIDAEGRFQYARVTLVRRGEPQQFAAGTCNNGRHEIRSKEPFGLTVWGFDLAASYAYPGGAGLRAISDAPISVPR